MNYYEFYINMAKKQTTISIDVETKKLAEQKAKKLNLPLSGVLRILLNDFAIGKIKIGTSVSEVDENGFTKAEQKELDEAIADIKTGKNFDGPVESMEEFIKILNKK
jgi:antitoxin component of RelBE/YafQ-DinJ toxin-antitoxin module